MNERAKLRRRILELDFAVYELGLFLDTHPANKKAMMLREEYRRRRQQVIAEYEAKYGNYIITADDVPASECWEWLSGPWPWEINFMEG